MDATDTFGSYAQEWLDQRIDLAERTHELYAWLLSRHILPTFEASPLSSINTPDCPSVVHRDCPHSSHDRGKGLSADVVDHAIGEDGRAHRHESLPGSWSSRRAGPGAPASRPCPKWTPWHANMPAELQIAVVLAAWCQLRRGEVRGLRRRDVDLEQGIVTIDVDTRRQPCPAGQS